MGRNKTGAITTGEAFRIKISHLLKSGYLVRGKVTEGRLVWNSQYEENTASICIHCSYPLEGPIEIRLKYQSTKGQAGEAEVHNELIRVDRLPSNLGKGEVLYFTCPQKGHRCKILYLCYGSTIWKSREAYKNRIYYPSQKASDLNYHNERYWQLEEQIERLKGKRGPGSYCGNPTKRAKRLAHLRFLQRIADIGRWRPESMHLSLRRTVYGSIPGYEYVNKKAKRA